MKQPEYLILKYLINDGLFVTKYYTSIFLRLFNCIKNIQNIMLRGKKQGIKLQDEFVLIWFNAYTLKNILKRNKLKHE